MGAIKEGYWKRDVHYIKAVNVLCIRKEGQEAGKTGDYLCNNAFASSVIWRRKPRVRALPIECKWVSCGPSECDKCLFKREMMNGWWKVEGEETNLTCFRDTDEITCAF